MQLPGNERSRQIKERESVAVQVGLSVNEYNAFVWSCGKRAFIKCILRIYKIELLKPSMLMMMLVIGQHWQISRWTPRNAEKEFIRLKQVILIRLFRSWVATSWGSNLHIIESNTEDGWLDYKLKRDSHTKKTSQIWLPSVSNELLGDNIKSMIVVWYLIDLQLVLKKTVQLCGIKLLLDWIQLKVSRVL